jgi:hypothetical protein
MNNVNLTNNALAANSAAGANKTRSATSGETGSWFEAMAKAWGETLDGQAQRITDLADQIGIQGKDNPETITMMTAESMRMQFISSSASTSVTSIGQALESLGRK